MPQQSTPGPIVTITFLALGVISSVIAILMVPALFHEVTSLRAAAFYRKLHLRRWHAHALPPLRQLPAQIADFSAARSRRE